MMRCDVFRKGRSGALHLHGVDEGGGDGFAIGQVAGRGLVKAGLLKLRVDKGALHARVGVTAVVAHINADLRQQGKGIFPPF